MFEKIKIAAGITAFVALVSFNPTHAHADPGDNNTGSGGAAIESVGTGSSGAPIESVGTGSSGAKPDKIGTGSPDYTKPAPEPKKGTPEHDLWEAGERARIANLQASKGRDGSPDICSDDKTSPNYCPVAGDDE